LLFVAFAALAVPNMVNASEEKHATKTESPHDAHREDDEHKHQSDEEHDHKADAQAEEHGSENEIELTPEQRRLIESQVLNEQVLGETIRATAEVRFNERRRVAVTARSEGWVQSIAVYAHEMIKTDQFLADIYSPGFLTAQHEYLLILDRFTKQQRSRDRALLDAARQRLSIFGLTEEEIAELRRTRKVFAYQHIHSPIEGTVIEHHINTGDNVTPGQKLYVIANLDTVWAEIALAETQLQQIRSGQLVSLMTRAHPGEKFAGKIESIGSSVDEKTRTVKARAIIQNPGAELKPGMFGEVEIVVGDKVKVLAVPQQALLRIPDGDWVIFIEEKPGHYKQIEVERQRDIAGQTIINGVPAGTRVVIKGAFFLQSELAKGGFDVHQH